jgi:alpha-tubulin suppressor-like RCC1 family protein
MKRISFIILILAVVVLGYGGLCQKKSSKDDTSSGSSNPFRQSLQQATSPVPADGAIDIDTTTQLSWAPVISATSYDVYFGTTAKGLTLVINTTTTTYNPGTLLDNARYYWRIDSKNSTGTTAGNIWNFQTIPLLWLEIQAGGNHTIARKVDGTLWAWGLNNYGQLGLGDIITRTTLTQIGNNSDWSMVNAGGSYYTGASHSVSLKTNGTIWVWGGNSYGQLGVGDTISRTTPTQLIIGTDSDWLSITAGSDHTIAIKTNTTIWAWGSNGHGQVGDGTVIRKTTPCQIYGFTSDWSTAAPGECHSLGLKTNRTLWAWGMNFFGQLGDGTETDRTTPCLIGTVSDWSMIASGESHSLGLKTNRTLWAWGRNGLGQLGDGTKTDRTTPCLIGTCSDWSMIAAGSTHTIAIKTGTTIWSWGFNYHGQLGLGDYSDRTTPSQVGTQTDWSLAVAGEGHTLALKINKTLWAWGDNEFGQLGFDDKIDRNIPYALGSPSAPDTLSASFISSSQINMYWIDNSSSEQGFKIENKTTYGGEYSLLTTVDSNITSFSHISSQVFASTIYYYYRVRAYNAYGDSPYAEVCTALSGDWSKIRCGYEYTIGLKSDGSLWAWGRNNYGQLGDGTSDFFMCKITPRSIGTNSDWSMIAAGNMHTIALKTDATLWAWGWNANSELGDGTTTSRNTPKQVIGSTSDWSVIDAGNAYSIALKTNGTLWTWGDNTNGQLGDGTYNTRNTPHQVFGSSSDWSMIASGMDHVIALKTSRTLWAWGLNIWGELGDGTHTLNSNTPQQVMGSASDWSMIAAGYAHSIALKTNRTIWVWGNNGNGQLGLGDSGEATIRTTPTQIGNDSNWSMIAAGNMHTIALKTDATLWVWGLNDYGQLGDGTTTNRTIPQQVIGSDSDWSVIDAGYAHSVVLKTNGTLWAWGANWSGQLGLGDSFNRNVPTMVGE